MKHRMIIDDDGTMKCELIGFTREELVEDFLTTKIVFETFTKPKNSEKGKAFYEKFGDLLETLAGLASTAEPCDIGYHIIVDAKMTDILIELYSFIIGGVCHEIAQASRMVDEIEKKMLSQASGTGIVS